MPSSINVVNKIYDDGLILFRFMMSFSLSLSLSHHSLFIFLYEIIKPCIV